MNKPLPFLLSAALFLFACSSSQTAGPESAAGASEASLPSSASSARDLTRQATFSDIVAAAETTTKRRENVVQCRAGARRHDADRVGKEREVSL